ncbi:MAG: hypothetical protein EOP11_00040 [Proteobacteria bacterium]|nr:MAG: hypothetical protein EOP11_00040 [Pseudomonadota bacterium]
MRLPFVVFLAFALGPRAAQALPNSPSLVLAIQAGTPLNVQIERMRVALTAVGNEGRLVLVVPKETRAQEMFAAARAMGAGLDEHLTVISNDEPGPDNDNQWIRDRSSGWEETTPGKFRMIGDDAGDVAGLNNFLSLCTDEQIGFADNRVRNVYGQGGNIISDGAGNCMAEPGPTAKKFAKAIACTNYIEKPDAELPGHPNSHTDIAAAFLAPGVAVVSALPAGCEGPEAKVQAEFFDAHARALEKGKIKVYRMPLAGPCPVKEAMVLGFPAGPRTPRELNRNDIYKLGAPGEAAVTFRSYSNLVQLKNAYILPAFLPPVGIVKSANCVSKKNCRLIPASPALKAEYEESNQRARNFLKKLIDDKIIPAKQILSLPVTHEDAVNGGATRCMTLEVPSDLKACSQENFARSSQRALSRFEAMGGCLAQVEDKGAGCGLARHFADVLGNLAFAAPKTRVKNLGKETGFGLKPEEKARLKPAYVKLQGEIKASCGY